MFPKLIFSYAALLFAGGILFMLLSTERDLDLVTPVAFGGIILIMGYLAGRDDLAMFGRHGATAISLIAFVTSVGSFADLFSGTTDTNIFVTWSKIYISLISLIFMVLAVRRFAAERPDAPTDKSN